MYWKIRRFIKRIPDIPYGITQGIKNIFIWFPVIWRDRDFDHSFLYEMLYLKLKNMQKYFESDYPIGANAKKTAKQIMIAKNLCKRLIEQKYLTNALTDYESKYGEDTFEWHTEPTENPKFHRLVWDWSEQQQKDFTKASNHSDYMEQQDLDYLFKLIRKNIQGWWD